MTDRIGQICDEVNRNTKDALQGVAQPLADIARAAQASSEAFQREHSEALAAVNNADVASKGEIQAEASLSGKVRHLRFIAESAERAEEELRSEVHELRTQLADLALIFSELTGRHSQTAA